VSDGAPSASLAPLLGTSGAVPGHRAGLARLEVQGYKGGAPAATDNTGAAGKGDKGEEAEPEVKVRRARLLGPLLLRSGTAHLL
jgi:hypothetical protein